MSMIEIRCHNDNMAERKYAINVLFNELVGIPTDAYTICFDEGCSGYEIRMGERCAMVADYFFIQYPNPMSYLCAENIPTSLSYFHGLGMEIPIIYGTDSFKEEQGRDVVGLDIFASTFFMLTRWEEVLLGREDKGDCDETQLFTVKHDIYQRAIVHEYETLLRILLNRLGFDTEIERSYHLVLTHDVDGIITPTWMDILKTLYRQKVLGLPKKRKPADLTWWQQIAYRKKYPTAFSQFQLYLDLCRKHQAQEWFYMKVCRRGEEECTYLDNDKRTKAVVSRINALGYSNVSLGFHPSQSTFGKQEQWNKEVERLKQLIGESPIYGRNHHLLYNGVTYRWWERLMCETKEGTGIVSNCVFHRRLGFRSGVAVPYTIFDLNDRKPLLIKEVPCEIMDSAIRLHKYPSAEAARSDIEKVIEEVRRYHGCMLLTWHIYIRSVETIDYYYKWCEETMRYASR